MMKFYELFGNDEREWIRELDSGQWATRDEAEQAAKDAVELTALVSKALRLVDSMGHQTTCRFSGCSCGAALNEARYRGEFLKMWRDHKAIIERYEGGKG